MVKLAKSPGSTFSELSIGLDPAPEGEGWASFLDPFVRIALFDLAAVDEAPTPELAMEPRMEHERTLQEIREICGEYGSRLFYAVGAHAVTGKQYELRLQLPEPTPT